MFTLSIYIHGEAKQDEIFNPIRQLGYYCWRGSAPWGLFKVVIPTINTSQLNELLAVADDNDAAFSDF